MAAARRRPGRTRSWRQIDEGVCWITLNRPEAGNAITAAMRNQMVAVAGRGLGGSRGAGGGADRRRGEGVLHRCGPALARSPDHPARRAPPTAPVGEAARLIRNGWQRLITAVLDCEKPVDRRGQRNRRRWWDAPGARLRPGARRRRGQLHRGVRPPWHRSGRRRRVPAPSPDRHRNGRRSSSSSATSSRPREAERLGLVNRVVPRAELHDLAAAVGGTSGVGPDPSHRGGQVPHQPLPRVGPGHRAVGRGGRAGAGGRYRGLSRGPSRVRGAARADVPGLVRNHGGTRLGLALRSEMLETQP